MNCWRLKPFFSLIALGGLIVGCSQQPPVISSVVLGPHQVMVRSGDTLYSLAAKHGVSLKELVEINRLGSFHLNVGQVLLLPQKSESKRDSPQASPVPSYASAQESVDPQLQQEIAQEKALRIQSDAPQMVPVTGPLHSPALSPIVPASPCPADMVTKIAVTKSPFIWPVNGTVVSSFNSAAGKRFDGIEIAAAAGTPVKAAADGTVKMSVENFGTYGNVLIVDSPDKTMTIYGHLEKKLLAKGTSIKQGDVIGKVAQIGKKSTLYFELRKQPVGGGKAKAVNPRPLLSDPAAGG